MNMLARRQPIKPIVLEVGLSLRQKQFKTNDGCNRNCTLTHAKAQRKRKQDQ